MNALDISSATSSATQAAAQQDLQAQKAKIQSLSKSQGNPEEEAKRMRKACEGFEAIFIQKMWDDMRTSLPKNGLTSSKEEEQWQSMYSQELGKSMASAGGIGLADMMMEQLTRNRADLSEASKSIGGRRQAMNISPAPLLPEKAQASITNQNPGKLDSQASASPNANLGASPTNVQTKTQAASGIYEGEAEYNAQVADADILAADPTASESPAQAAEVNPPAVRQTLDELVGLMLAQGMEVPGVAAQQPQVNRIVYTTNLPPSQRKGVPQEAMNLLTQPSQSRDNGPQGLLSGLASSPAGAGIEGNQGQAMAFATSSQAPNAAMGQGAAQVQQVAQASASFAPAPPRKPGVPENDILAGISARYKVPSFIPNQNPNRFMPETLLAQEPDSLLQAGGPHLVQPEMPETFASPVALGNPAPPAGLLQAPVQGKISSGFGWRLDPITGQRAWHAGMDISAKPGEGVKSAQAGVVSFAGYDAELGNLVVVDHGEGLRTLYGHNQNLTVKPGDAVEQGMEIAKAGSSGRAAGVHVHFEVRRGSLALNPEPLVNAGNSSVLTQASLN